MKRPIDLRKGFALPELLTYSTIRKAVRPLLRADAFVIVLVPPPGMQTSPYFRVADYIVNDWDPYRRGNAVIEFDPKRVESSIVSIRGALEEETVFLIFPDEQSIPVFPRLAADAVVALDRPSVPQMKGVFRALHGASLTDMQVELFLLLDEDLQREVARPGRSVGRMLSQLVMPPEQPRYEQPPSPRRSDEGDELPTLESMSGYGEAKEWGLQLARDLKDWRDGLIPWHDVDRGLLLSGPPGVGKTVFAEALANTCGADLIVGSAARWQARGHLGDM